MKILSIVVAGFMMFASTSYANQHKGKKKGHDKEHRHVPMKKADHAHDSAHHGKHDHLAHHPEHKEDAGHDKEHRHVSGKKVDHAHEEAHHGEHDHLAHHPEHKEQKSKRGKKKQ
jgi:hypothetical protein